MKNFIAFWIVILLLNSCENLLMEPPPEYSPEGIFEEVWEFADKEYSFFEYKKVDWDSTYKAFKPRVYNGMGEIALFEQLSDMLYTLRDGHVNLVSPFDVSRNWTWYLNHPDNFDKYVLERNYFRENEQYVGPFIIYDFGDIGYIYYESFMNNIWLGAIAEVMEAFIDKKGIIIDVRNNFGGSLANVFELGERFVSKNEVVARQRFKNGPGRNDFTELKDMEFEYDVRHFHFTGPVVVLTNRKSYSAGNFFPTCMSALDNVTIMGDVTGGGGGAPSFTELSNGWIIRVSATQLFTLDGVNTEDGLEPDIRVDITDADKEAGVDTILEEALKLLRE